MKPAISIIIVNYNCARDTAACVASLRATHGVDYEIIVVDNASRPQDRELLGTLESVTLVLEDRNGGFGAGCNRGAERAGGRYLLFVNPDIVLNSPTTLAELVHAADGIPQLGALSCRIVFEDGRPQPSAHRRYPGLASHVWDYSPAFSSALARVPGLRAPGFFASERYATDTLSAAHLLGAFLLVPRAIFERVGGFDEGFFLYREETDLCQRIAALGLAIIYLPEPVVVHVAGTSTHNRDFANLDARYMESTYRYLRLNHSAAYVNVAWTLAFAGMVLSLPVARVVLARKRAAHGRTVELDLLMARLPAAIGWHWRQRREVGRPVRRRLPGGAIEEDDPGGSQLPRASG